MEARRSPFWKYIRSQKKFDNKVKEAMGIKLKKIN